MRRLGSLAFALALLIPQAVSAAPAYLRADHNPVIVQPRQTTGNFTLSWSSGTAIVPALYVNYGGLDQSVPITAATGTLVEQAIIGVTSTYKLYASSARLDVNGRDRLDAVGHVLGDMDARHRRCQQQQACSRSRWSWSCIW